MVNSYYDLNDYENPIHSFIEDRLYFRGINGFLNDVRLYFQNNQVEAQDEYLSIIPQPKRDSFISLSEVENSISINENEVTKFWFVKSNQETTIERSVFTFLDLLGNLGGIFEVLSVLGSIFVTTFSKKLFQYSILSSLYQVDMMRCQLDHKDESNNFKNKSSVVNLTMQKSEDSKSIDLVNNPIRESSKQDPYYEHTLETITDFNQSLFDAVRMNIENRRLYNYKTTDLCYNILCCCKLKLCN